MGIESHTRGSIEATRAHNARESIESYTHDNTLYCQYRIMTIIRLIHVRAER
ncbi:hypothetical protein QJV46_gp61 [Serratia phage vB_SmaS_Opt-155]|uniref:Uncharacterized protein n=1 Tax=Serratia phage vB_SmaS_Opt-155 TaxID=2902690 RepID=A0AC61TQ32_9CAUD|nr:hypothetical protein QJV46_gp61 [Serratia phage vB_SmaS_Opt-155]UGO52764.1 hypothetical protein OPT155_61 [Serratia phage vB_SmaS_Opt-155]